MIGALLERNPKFANWLYGFTPPERGTVVLVHRRVYIVPAQLGWFFVLTLFILLIGSINYSLSLCFALTLLLGGLALAGLGGTITHALSLGFALPSLLGGLALAGMVHTARNPARMAVTAGRAEPVFA